MISLSGANINLSNYSWKAILLNCESEGSHCLYVNGCSIEPSEVVTLLGVRLDNRLVFNHNTNELCKKTGRQVNFRAFILSNFQYLPAIWHHCSVSNTKNYKKSKNGLCGMSQTTIIRLQTLLRQSSLPSLEEGRRQQIAIQTFKMVNNLSPPYLQDLITPRKCTRILRNSVKTLEMPFYNRVRHGTNSFSILALKISNNLPEEIRTLSDLPSFRKAIATGLYTAID